MRTFLILITAFVALSFSEGPGEVNGDSTTVVTSFRSGDAIKVQVFPDTMGFPNGVYFIDSRGYADLPVVGRIKVEGRGSKEITEYLKENWAEYLRYPNVQVRPVIRISLLGGFARPGFYCIDPHLSLWNAVHIAGGTVRSDGLKKMVWERGGKVISKDLVTILESGKSLYDVGFQTGDQLRVTAKPERGAWEVIRQDVFPTLTLLLSVATTSLALYNSYKD